MTTIAARLTAGLVAALTALTAVSVVAAIDNASRDRLRPVAELQYVEVRAGESYFSIWRDLGLSCTHTELWQFNRRAPLDPGSKVEIPPRCLAPMTPTSTTSTTSTTIASSTTTVPTTVPPLPALDDLLVPTDPGEILLGSSFGSSATGVVSYQAIVGRPPEIAHQYATSATQFRSRLAATPSGSIPFVNLKPLGTMGGAVYRRILAGEADAALDAVARHIVDYGRPMFVAVMHEPENDGTAADDADYARAYRYSVERMKAAGASNAVWVWNMMGSPSHAARYDALWPGGDVVDWIAADRYIQNEPTFTFRGFVDRTSSATSGWPGFYTWAATKAPGTPQMLGEWGISAQTVAQVAPRLLTQTEVDRMQVEMPMLRALVYWNSTGENDYRLANFPDDWRRFVALPEFAVDVSAVAKP